MLLQRSSHTATLLTNGTVLVVGGNATSLPVGEIIDLVNGFSKSDGVFNYLRSSHASTLMFDGSVLVSGGVSNGVLSARLEGFTPGSPFSFVSGFSTPFFS